MNHSYTPPPTPPSTSTVHSENDQVPSETSAAPDCEELQEPWYVPNKLSIDKWTAQFAREDGDFQHSPFANEIDALVFDYIFRRSGSPLTSKEATGIISLVERVLNTVYNTFNISSGQVFPSRLSELRKIFNSFKVSKVESVSTERRSAGRGRGKPFVTRALRLPSQILFQIFLHPEKSKKMIRVGRKDGDIHSVTCSDAVQENPLLRCLCIQVESLSKHVYLDDSVEFGQTLQNMKVGKVMNIFSSAEFPMGCLEVLLHNESTLSVISAVDILSIIPNLLGRGRSLLAQAGVKSEMEIVSVPLMLFSDDMNAGRTKTFSKMDNTVLCCPTVLDERGLKSRHHLTSSKCAPLQVQLKEIFQDIAKLRKGVILFDVWRRKPVFVISDLLAILADNPRANEICGQAQGKCRFANCTYIYSIKLLKIIVLCIRREPILSFFLEGTAGVLFSCAKQQGTSSFLVQIGRSLISTNTLGAEKG
tara:strand:+ start:1456 stop:2886 length:1431 start_codon:yes stop_codon:yes gene_type:complete